MTDRGDGKGLQFGQFNATAREQKEHNGASGVPRLGKRTYSLKNAELRIGKAKLK